MLVRFTNHGNSDILILVDNYEEAYSKLDAFLTKRPDLPCAESWRWAGKSTELEPGVFSNEVNSWGLPT